MSQVQASKGQEDLVSKLPAALSKRLNSWTRNSIDGPSERPDAFAISSVTTTLPFNGTLSR